MARKWAELTEDKRKEWAAKAEAVCTLSIQVRYTTSVSSSHLYTLVYIVERMVEPLTTINPSVKGTIFHSKIEQLLNSF